MGYSKSTYIEARKIIDKRAEAAKKTAAVHTAEIHAKFPEIKALDAAIANTASHIISAIGGPREELSGKLDMIKRENLALQEKRNKLLLANGYPENYTKENYHCEKCEDTGFTLAGECECLKRELARITIENSGIGNLVNTQSFDNFDLKYYASSPVSLENMRINVDYLKMFVEKFNENTKTNFLFMGATGLGKTHLSTAVAMEVINKGFEVVYDTAQNILSDFEHEKFKKDYSSSSSEKETSKYFSCDLLIIDDLGTELTNSFTVSVLYNLINTRLNTKKPMIISTNLDFEEITRRYEERIESRLMGEFTPILFTGTDIRMQKLN